MKERSRLRVALQKNGRLNEKSLSLLKHCGLEFGWGKDKLLCGCENMPLDLMLVRDDDIPEYVCDGVCDAGLVGENILKEKLLARSAGKPNEVEVLRRLGFGRCRLSLAGPEGGVYEGARSLAGKRVATSYPASLRDFLKKRGVACETVELSGSVEIAPKLEIADFICDIVSTGSTLKSNGLVEHETILESECVLVKTGRPLSGEQEAFLKLLLQRIDGVLKAAGAKYIMMNAPLSAVPQIAEILPGMEDPTVIPLGGGRGKVAVHAVSYEPVFWETMERLKGAGASSILVVPIEKIIE